jgi:hypothetical protein
MVGFVMRTGGTMEAHPVECFFAKKDGAGNGEKAS